MWDTSRSLHRLAFLIDREQEGFTPFLSAARYGNVTLLKLLHKYGADVHALEKASE